MPLKRELGLGAMTAEKIAAVRTSMHKVVCRRVLHNVMDSQKHTH